MKTNTAKKAEPKYTHGGARAATVTPELQLRRSVLSCLLWEDEHYEDGKTIASRIKDLVAKVAPETVAALAIEARTKMNLRHVPLFLVREMARLPTHKGLVADTLYQVIQRPDELGEFLAIYWKEGRTPVANSVSRGLAAAFDKFDEFTFAKYDRDATVKLRDVMFKVHPNPANKEREKLYKKIANRTLKTPDTWEVQLSAGKDKKAVFTRLLKEGKLGALALLRNLRNMQEAGVERELIKHGLANMRTERVLPFRFIAAANHAPDLEPELEVAMLKCLNSFDKLTGKTIFVVDISGSMNALLSARSQLGRLDAACALAILGREMAEDAIVYATAGDDGTMVHATGKVASRHGFALRDAIKNMSGSLGGGGIFLKQVMDFIREREKTADRIIVITDEQDCDRDSVRSPKNADAFGERNYLINVASAANGIGYDKWTHIDGWSDAVLQYIVASESEQSQEPAPKPSKRKVSKN